MKNLVILVVVMLLAGCAGTRQAALDISSPNVIKHGDTNLSLLQPSIGPNELANARLTLALARQIEKGGIATGEEGKYVGVIINIDPTRTAIVHHPEMAIQLKIPPGGHEFISTSDIPREIFVNFSGDSRNHRKKMFRSAKVYNGVKIDYGARIEN